MRAKASFPLALLWHACRQQVEARSGRAGENRGCSRLVPQGRSKGLLEAAQLQAELLEAPGCGSQFLSLPLV